MKYITKRSIELIVISIIPVIFHACSTSAQYPQQRPGAGGKFPPFRPGNQQQGGMQSPTSGNIGSQPLPEPESPLKGFFNIKEVKKNESSPFGVDNPFVKMGGLTTWNGKEGAELVREMKIAWAMPSATFGVNPKNLIKSKENQAPPQRPGFQGPGAGGRPPMGGGMRPPMGGGMRPPMGGGMRRPGGNNFPGRAPTGQQDNSKEVNLADLELDFSRFDDYVKYSQAINLQLLFIVGTRELSSKPPPNPPAYPANMAQYTNVIARFVERYDGDGMNDMPGLKYPVKYWMILNEPFYKRFWGGSAKEYCDVFIATRKAIKSVDKNAKVVLSSLFSPNKKETFDFAEDFLHYFEREVRRGNAEPAIDAVDLHWISKKEADIGFKEYKEGWEWLLGKFEKSGISIEEKICTEACILNKDRAAVQRDVVKRYLLARTLGVTKIFWSSLVSADPGRDMFTAISLKTADRDPVISSYKFMANQIGDSNCSLREQGEIMNILLPGGKKVVWATKSTTETITEKGVELFDLAGKKIKSEKLRITQDPVYVVTQ